MDSLQAMMQLGLKNSAAYALPQQQQQERAMGAEDLRAKQLANDNSAAMNPLNAQFRQGQINEQGAMLPGQQAQSQILGSQAKFDVATESQRIAQKISSMGNQIGVDGMQTMAREGQIATQAAAMLKNYPPALHKEVLKQIYTNFGGSPDSPMLKGLMQLPDDKVADAALATGKGMALASSEYFQKSTMQSDENQSQEKIARGHDATSLEVARIQAEAKKQVAAARASVIKNLKPEDQITALSGIPEAERTPEEQAQLTQLTQYMLSKAAAGSNQVPGQVLDKPTNQQTARETGANIFGGNKPAAKTIVRTGTANGRKVIQYSDGSMEYAN